MSARAFPFGSRLREVVQTDRTPKLVFVLGVYASAVHAQWRGPDGKVLIRALAVASEPEIFWDGSNAHEIISAITVPDGAGTLEPADARLNGPSGRSLDHDFLAPLGVDRSRAWLCDLVPHTCLNDGQAKALAREYEPRRKALRLPQVTLPPVPKTFAGPTRRAEILNEIREASPSVLVLLGDKPIQAFLHAYVDRWSKLADFGDTPQTYGHLHRATLADLDLAVLPLAHPRQVSGLGRHSPRWRELHRAWTTRVAPGLLERSRLLP